MPPTVLKIAGAPGQLSCGTAALALTCSERVTTSMRSMLRFKQLELAEAPRDG